MSPRSRASARIVSLMIAASFEGFAFAQEEPSAADIAAARTMGIEGMRLADQGKCEEALDKLARAEKIYHAPTTLDRLGECQVQVGRVVEGTENLRRLTRETLAANAPTAFVNAQERAKAALPKAMLRVAKLKVIVHAPDGVTPTVTIDGKTISAATIGADRPADPGEHTIEASAPGYLKASGKTKLEDGGSGSVELKLEADPNAATTVTPPTAPSNPTTTPVTPPPTTPDTSVVKHNYTPAVVVGAIGGVGLVTGVIFGVVAMSGKGSLLDQCNQTTKCPPSAKSTYDTTSTEATVSTIGFIVGGVGLATMAVLIAVAPTVKTTTALQFDVGPQSMMLRGRF